MFGFYLSRTSLFSLGNCLSPSQVVLVGCRDDHVVQAWPIMTQRKAVVCNEWPKEWGNQSPPWGLKNGLEGWGREREITFSSRTASSNTSECPQIPVSIFVFTCNKLDLGMKTAKESRPGGKRGQEGSLDPAMPEACIPISIPLRNPLST